MIFWIFSLLMTMLIPGMMVGIGWWFGTYTPRKINRFYGYRTRMSMKNMDTWVFAHKKSGEVWRRWGKWMLLTAAPMVLVIGKSEDAVGSMSAFIVLAQIVPLLASIYPVEKALRENFDQDGNRRRP